MNENVNESADVEATRYESILVTGLMSEATVKINSFLRSGWVLKKNHPEIILVPDSGYIYLIGLLYRPRR